MGTVCKQRVQFNLLQLWFRFGLLVRFINYFSDGLCLVGSVGKYCKYYSTETSNLNLLQASECDKLTQNQLVSHVCLDYIFSLCSHTFLRYTVACYIEWSVS